jgi:hypothetical protein
LAIAAFEVACIAATIGAITDLALSGFFGSFGQANTVVGDTIDFDTTGELEAAFAATLFLVVGIGGAVVFAGAAKAEAVAADVAEVDASVFLAHTNLAAIAAIRNLGLFAAEVEAEVTAGFAGFLGLAIGVVVFAFVSVADLDTNGAILCDAKAAEVFGGITAEVGVVANLSWLGDGARGEAKSFGLSKGDLAGLTARIVAILLLGGACTFAYTLAILADESREAVGFGCASITGLEDTTGAGIDTGQAEIGVSTKSAADKTPRTVEEIFTNFATDTRATLFIGDDTSQLDGVSLSIAGAGITKLLDGIVASVIFVFGDTADAGKSRALWQATFVVGAGIGFGAAR